jgi:molybdopterin-containing oxidoreductase family iron-sulfur binding subunit
MPSMIAEPMQLTISAKGGAMPASGPDGVPSRRATGKEYWASLDELADTGEFRSFVHNEFPSVADELLNGEDRRSFLKIMGASLALAGLSMTAGGCRRWPKEQILPFAHRPEGFVPGAAQRYATSWDVGGVARGHLVTCYDGRPVKIEGNPQHPINLGGTDAISQASILDLYDPDRSRKVKRAGAASSWEEFARWVDEFRQSAGRNDGEGVCVLCEASSSPSLAAMRARFLDQFPNARWYTWEPLTTDNEVRGSMLAFGSPHRALCNLSHPQTQTIIALDCDLLGTHPASVRHARQYATGRTGENGMNRLYVVESALTVTGAKADHRFAVRSSDVAIVAAKLASKVLGESSADVASAIGALAQAALPAVSEQAIDAMASDLRDAASRGHASVIAAGPHQPPEVHAMVHMMNIALGNAGKSVMYVEMPEATPQLDQLRELAQRLAAGQVSTLFIIGGNPAYDAPIDLDLPAKIKGVATTVRLSDYEDETSALCTWQLPRAHYLEAWGDGRAYDGTLCITQPMIEPLFGGRSPIELIARLSVAEDARGYDIVRETFAELAGSGRVDETAWRSAVHDGVWGDAAPAATPSVNASAARTQLQTFAQQRAQNAGGTELVFRQAHGVYDGRFANNGWLQELPDPISKLTWDNALQMSPATAARLGVESKSMVRITRGQMTLAAVVHVIPGHADDSLSLALGYGRSMPGRICANAGFNAYALRTSDAMWIASDASVQSIGETYALATTEHHNPIDSVGEKGVQERLPTIYRSATLDEYKDHPDFAKHRAHVPHRLSLWEEDWPFQPAGTPEPAHAWGMSIDLSACTGCGACIVACQAENNIPIVGKDQVLRGREMHWIRVDRYFKFGKTNGHYDANKIEHVGVQPMTCQHCENAPCEQVCPVAATVHDTNGLNVMVYNRCIGTRYCSNNCPYKVRRFNYFDFHRKDPSREVGLWQVNTDYFKRPQATSGNPLKAMQHNPEVTVRVRGVMEKCTFCVQRLTNATIDAKNAWVKQSPEQKKQHPRVVVDDAAVVPACAQACPAQAIVLGDLRNPKSAVLAAHRHHRSYELLEEINTKPRNRYLANLRNPNSTLEPAHHDAPAHGAETHHG